MRTSQGDIEAGGTQLGFWGTLGTAIAGLVKHAGCSAHHCPLPEIREAARDLREWDRSPAATDEQPLAA